MKKIYVEMVADLFHYGHVEFLRKAKELGDYLVVGVLSDDWAREYKKQPILTWEERARVVEGCRYVDEVLRQPEPVSAAWLKENGFERSAVAFGNQADHDRHMKICADYEQHRQTILPYEPSISTTSIIQRIQERDRTRAAERALIKQAFASRWKGGEWLLAEQMLRDVSQIFAAHDIPWFLTFGSFLGAIRHQGIIPWDDDIDIAIFERDEQRLRSLAGHWEKAGYGLTIFNKSTDRGTGIYFKLWIRSKPPASGRIYSWPYIDIFVVCPSADENTWLLDNHPFPANYFMPFRKARFGRLDLPVPASDDLLPLMYSPDYMAKCVSPPYLHRHETPCPSIMRPVEEVKEAGCFAPVDETEQKIWASVPVKIPGWSLAGGGDSPLLIREGVSLKLNVFMAALWNMADGKRSVGEMVNCQGGPRIEAMYKVIDSISVLQKSKALRVEEAGLP